MTLTHLEPGFQGRQSYTIRAKYTAQSTCFMNQKTTDEIIVYATNTESG